MNLRAFVTGHQPPSEDGTHLNELNATYSQAQIFQQVE
jgi:hypothetical protein